MNEGTDTKVSAIETVETTSAVATGVYASGKAKSAFQVSIALQLTDEQRQKLVEEGITSSFFRGGNSLLDRHFAPKKLDAKGKLVPVTKGFERESVKFSPENAAVIQGLLQKFFAGGDKPLAAGATITVTEKLPGGEDAGGIKLFLAKAQAWLAGKSDEQVTKAAEQLEKRNPGVKIKWVKDAKGSAVVDVESFAIALKADTKRIQDEATKNQLDSLLAGGEAEEVADVEEEELESDVDDEDEAVEEEEPTEEPAEANK